MKAFWQISSVHVHVPIDWQLNIPTYEIRNATLIENIAIFAYLTF